MLAMVALQAGRGAGIMTQLFNVSIDWLAERMGTDRVGTDKLRGSYDGGILKQLLVDKYSQS